MVPGRSLGFPQSAIGNTPALSRVSLSRRILVRHLRLSLLLLLASSVCFLVLPRQLRADDWLPISPEEIKMTSEPKAPGAPAIYLYRQVDRDDTRDGSEINYARIKILTEEGRKYADIEIPFFKQMGVIHNIKARTIRPDGTIVPFDGKVYEKTIVKAKGIKYLAKTFTLPDIQVGSIIDYRYTLDLERGFVFDSHWTLSEELFTKKAKFSLKPNGDFGVTWSWPVGLPQGTLPPKEERGMVRLESNDIPAFQVEDFMPPQDTLKFRVEFVYQYGIPEKDPAKFWKREGKKRNGDLEGFINKRGALEAAVSQVVSPSDTPEVKLQKLYARAQKIRNISYERAKTEQEEKRDKQKDVDNAEELLRSGAGNGRQINYLLVGLARAAGLEAYSVHISSRNEYFFNPHLMKAQQLNGDVVLVKVSGKDIFLDPGTAFVPYGLLPWEETAVQGLKLDKDGGSWVQTSLPESGASKVERKADLKLTDTGDLEGTLTINFSGLDALRLRLDERLEDDAHRKTTLEDLVRESIPAAIEVDLTNKPEWNSSAPTLVAQYSLKIPGWASGAGRRALLPVGLFGSDEKHLFEHANRTYPVYFHYPYQKTDDVAIVFPLGWSVGSVPKPIHQDTKAVAYILQAEDNKGSLHIARTLRSELVAVDVKNYEILRGFFQLVRSGDEQQVILQPGN
jgi:uncharacterized protein DUF3857